MKQQYFLICLAIIVSLFLYFYRIRKEKFEDATQQVPMLSDFSDCIRKKICLKLTSNPFTLTTTVDPANPSVSLDAIDMEVTDKLQSWMWEGKKLFDMTGHPVSLQETEFPAKDRNGTQMVLTLSRKFPFIDRTYKQVQPLGQMTSLKFLNVPIKLNKDENNHLIIEIPDTINKHNIYYNVIAGNVQGDIPQISLQQITDKTTSFTILDQNSNLTQLKDKDDNPLLLPSELTQIGVDVKNATGGIIKLGTSPTMEITFSLTEYLPGWNFIYGWIRKSHVVDIMNFVLKLRNTEVFTVRLPNLPNYKYSIGMVTEIPATHPSTEHFMNAQTFSVSRLLQDAIEAVYMAAPTNAPEPVNAPEPNIPVCPECPKCQDCPACPACPVCPLPTVVTTAAKKRPPKLPPKPAPNKKTIIIPPKRRGGKARIIQRFSMPFDDNSKETIEGFTNSDGLRYSLY